MCKKLRIIDAAIEQAEQSSMFYKHGAIITKSSKILSRGFNNPRSHFMSINSTCLHAEMDVILSYCTNILHINIDHRRKNIYVPQLSKCILWVVRVSKTNTLTESKPCSDCLSFIKRIGVKKIAYTNKEGNLVLQNTKNISSTHLSHAQKLTKNL
jgi:deoxycytidylate deaminase